MRAFTFCLAFAQFGPQQIISQEATGAFKSFPYDVDNDGFTDIISVYLGKIVWYKNHNGLGNFSEENILIENLINLEQVKLYDLNNDGLKDIIYTSYQATIAWIQNLNGQGDFGNEQIIAQGNYPNGYPYRIEVSDIDGDGDNDVFANLYHNSIFNRLVWYENVDGLGNFSEEIIIEINDYYDSDLTLFDLDNDGDNDLITSYESFNPGTLIWYENIDGQGSFSASQELFQFNYSSDWVNILQITHTDFNNDGKTDILFDTYHEVFTNKLFWLENIDANGTFSEPLEILNYTDYLGSLTAYDIDNDNDNDVLISFCSDNSSRIIWVENLDGLGNFGQEITISTEVDCGRFAEAADFNGDTLLDVVPASSNDNKIAWYENIILGIKDEVKLLASVYPNPTTGKITIDTNQEIKLLVVYNLIGQKLITTTKQLDFSSLPTGIYIY